MSKIKNRNKGLSRRKQTLRERLLHSGLRFVFRVGGRWLPGPTTHLAYRLWFTTRRYPTPLREVMYEETATREYLDHAGTPLATYRWGNGPAVLLVHGWSGRGTQLFQFVDPLVDAGYQVIAVDAPAHGRTPGTQTNLFQYVAALETVANRFGPFDGVIAHSFGTPAVMLAVHEQKLSAKRVVAISPPSTMLGMLTKFADMLDLHDNVTTRLRQRIEREFGDDIWHRLSVETIAPQLNVAALVVHDEQDDEVPIDEGETTASRWPGARFIRTQGYGHRRILRAHPVIDAAVTFIAHGEVDTNIVSAPTNHPAPSQTDATHVHSEPKETDTLETTSA